MTTNEKGNIAESKVLTYFLELGYEVYLPFGTATTNDMVVIKDNTTKRVSVKSTSSKSKSGKWEVRVRQITHLGTTLFDNSKTDLLVVYIIPENRIVVLEAKDIKAKTGISVN